MSSSASVLRSLRVVLGVLVVFGLAGSAFALLPGNRSRELAEGFAHALDGQADMRLDDYLAPDAEVFVQGATTALSPPQFRHYLDQLKRSRHAFHASSPVYLTEDGAGWLLELKNLSETAIANPPGIESPAQLWMQARIGERHITRLWIHFTVEALARLHSPADLYRARAVRQDIPLPEAWQDGTAAMVQAAERRDPGAAGVWSQSTKRALIVAVWAPMLIVIGAAGARGIPRKRQPARLPSGQMLARLGQMHSAAPAVRPGGSGELAPAPLARRSAARTYVEPVTSLERGPPSPG
jgi:hypothetical protein